ncbi:hypothetical protein PHYPSEUDO_002594 [Phytophthora pseudosyringae]|uniref:Uncharacterized protein n=1 Tax=Phytophthora pseudosyringae TaxID=221518 RepID=A0A8T1V6K9_9STRA|nr:hypothetical protein PHYPSEUDO_002594 [Phytophthora pseudosyringae]
MSPLSIAVFFQAANSLTYVNPGDWACLTFEGCSFWKPTKLIAWTNLPAGKFIRFYETNTCYAGGKHYFLSRNATATHDFEPPQAIRSVMIGNHYNYTRRPSVITSQCFSDKERAILDESKNSDANYTSGIEWSNDGSTAAGGLSSNWSDAIPGMSVGD